MKPSVLPNHPKWVKMNQNEKKWSFVVCKSISDPSVTQLFGACLCYMIYSCHGNTLFTQQIIRRNHTCLYMSVSRNGYPFWEERDKSAIKS